MVEASPFEGLILDYGRVLTLEQPAADLAEMASLADLPGDEFLEVYWRHRPDYDRGLPGREYWRRVLGHRASERRIGDIIEVDVRSWLHYREPLWDLVSAFRARGGRTAMLSNGVPEIVARLRAERDLAHWFDAVVISCEVGCAKPDRDIYDLCLRQLDTPAPVSLFVDDRHDNLEGATGAGLRTLLFAGDESIERLARILDI